MSHGRVMGQSRTWETNARQRMRFALASSVPLRGVRRSHVPAHPFTEHPFTAQLYSERVCSEQAHSEDLSQSDTREVARNGVRHRQWSRLRYCTGDTVTWTVGRERKVTMKNRRNRNKNSGLARERDNVPKDLPSAHESFNAESSENRLDSSEVARLGAGACESCAKDGASAEGSRYPSRKWEPPYDVLEPSPVEPSPVEPSPVGTSSTVVEPSPVEPPPVGLGQWTHDDDDDDDDEQLYRVTALATPLSVHRAAELMQVRVRFEKMGADLREAVKAIEAMAQGVDAARRHLGLAPGDLGDRIDGPSAWLWEAFGALAMVRRYLAATADVLTEGDTASQYAAAIVDAVAGGELYAPVLLVLGDCALVEVAPGRRLWVSRSRGEAVDAAGTVGVAAVDLVPLALTVKA